MSNPNFRSAKRASALALILSVLVLASSCALPELLIERLYKDVGEKLEQAVSCAIEEDYATAYDASLSVLKRIEDNEKTMLLCFDHSDVYGLIGSLKSAANISVTEDAAQLIEELNDALTILKAMRRMNDASIFNLF